MNNLVGLPSLIIEVAEVVGIGVWYIERVTDLSFVWCLENHSVVQFELKQWLLLYSIADWISYIWIITLFVPMVLKGYVSDIYPHKSRINIPYVSRGIKVIRAKQLKYELDTSGLRFSISNVTNKFGITLICKDID